jgi:signal transduction histidine kinase
VSSGPDSSRLQRRYERERQARKQAESLLEEKSQELFTTNQQLQRLLEELEKKVEERTEDLVFALRSAQQASEVKSDFLAMVSHEIRTPMNAMQGMAELLLDTELSDQQRHNAEVIFSASRGLQTILNDLLDLNQIEAGKMLIERVDFSLKRLVDDVVNTFRHKAELKGLVLEIGFEHDNDPVYFGDPTRLRQLLLNLVSNAIKYTPAGAISINVQRESVKGPFTHLRFTVTDTGPGLDATQQEQAFERFTRLDHADRDRTEGIGLGLGLCR